MKYRVWNPHNKTMSYPDLNDFVVDQQGNVYYAAFSDPILWAHCVALYCLDSEDKTGKELYEGDIYFDEFTKEYGQVEHVALFLLRAGAYGERMQYSMGGSIGIVGNIFQNPELLGKINKEE